MKPLEPGTRLGSVRLEGPIAEGGTSVVYKGHHVHLATDVAVKIMAPRKGHSVDDRNRFLREARIAARLNDPSIVRVYDFGERGQLCYLVMELVQGVTLEQYLQQRPTKPSERTIFRLLRRVTRALRVSHAAGLVHRDLKPANILIDQAGQLKVADFGLARGSGAPAVGSDGLFNGTPLYMAPECATAGARVDQRADLYCLGVIGYELIFGRPPYEGDNVREILEGHRSGRAPFDLPTHCSERLVAIVQRLMAPDPEARFQNAEQLLQGLEHARHAGKQDPDTSTQSNDSEPGSGLSRGSDDFSSMVRLLEQRFAGRVSEHPEGKVVHSTPRERAMVWMLLAATVGAAVAGYLARG
ncbi:MAG: serine/threonine-protein kinase [Myxococcales bacterium]|nr:serine/threonine-protein kinase [Myxococcales bacterium]